LLHSIFFSAGSFSYTMEHMGPITNSKKKNNVNRCEISDKSSPNKGKILLVLEYEWKQ
jgi:hypothetical protein